MSDDEPTTDLTAAPRVASWLVQKLCIADQLESIEGDLLELYERRSRRFGLARARRDFWRDALGACVRHSRLLPWLGRVGRKLFVHGTALFIVFYVCMPAMHGIGKLLDPHPVLNECVGILLPMLLSPPSWLLYRVVAYLIGGMIERVGSVSRRV